MKRRGKPPKYHQVHGERMTVKQAAARLGMPVTNIETWRSFNRAPDGGKASLEAAFEHYTQFKGRTGRRPRRHRVRGHLTTVRALAEAHKLPVKRLQLTMNRHGCSLEEALDFCERQREDRAVRQILKIIYGEA